MEAVETADPLAVLEKLAKNPKALGDLAAAKRKSDLAAKEAAAAEAQAEQRLAKAAKAEHVLTRERNALQGQKDVLAQEKAAFDEAQKVSHASIAKDRKDIATALQSVQQREAMLVEESRKVGRQAADAA